MSTRTGEAYQQTRFHRIIRENVCPKEFRDIKRPVLMNNWEGTY
ncbi:Melibiase [Butyrivibrio sp. ob235]|nr:Melibiase [Butyrivibrio sp. ob235]